MGQEPELAPLIGSRGSSDFIRASGPSPRQGGHMTEGRQPFTAEIKTLAKGPSTYDPLENGICANGTAGVDMKDITKEPLKAAPVHTSAATKKNSLEMCVQVETPRCSVNTLANRRANV